MRNWAAGLGCWGFFGGEEGENSPKTLPIGGGVSKNTPEYQYFGGGGTQPPFFPHSKDLRSWDFIKSCPPPQG